MLRVKDICKSYNNVQVLFDLRFNVWKGEIVWFLWPNWAWKSTTMRIITGFITPNSWEVLIEWKSIHSDVSLKSRIWYLAESNPLYFEMWVDEFLYYTASLKWVKDPDFEVAKVIKMTWLQDKANKFIWTLSKWYKQRVWLAQALIGDPEILVLDEPTEWLDPTQRDEMKKLIKSLWKNKTIIISSHVLTEIASLVNRVIIISDWKIKLDDSVEHISQLHEWKIKLKIIYSWPEIQKKLTKHFENIEVNEDVTWETIKLEIISSTDIKKEIMDFINSHWWNIHEFYTEKQSLEDIFFDIIN